MSSALNAAISAKTPFEYVLGIVSEEATEVIGAIEKIRRFSAGNLPCSRTGKITNLAALQDEVTDLLGSIEQLNLEIKRLGGPIIDLNDGQGKMERMLKIQRTSARSLEAGVLGQPLVDPTG